MMNFDNEIKTNYKIICSCREYYQIKPSWHAQTGGQTNKVWRLSGEKDLICKLYLETKTNPLFNNTPEAGV